MLEYNRILKKRKTMLIRAIALMIPVFCVVSLLTQTVFAKNTYRITDGERVFIHTTYATDPAAVLDEAGLELSAEDLYTTQNSTGISEINVQRKQTITVDQWGVTRQISSYGESVESLLARLKLKLTDEDVVSHPMDAQTFNGMTITITRTTTYEESYTVAIDHDVVYCYDAALKAGEEKVLTAGSDGQRLVTATVSLVNGVEVERTVTQDELVLQPTTAIIAVGTYTEDMTPNAGSSESITMPEVSVPTDGKPVIGDGTIITPEGEVLTFSHAAIFKATAYTHTDPGCNEWTATGTHVRVGTVAVDPRVIPYGTKMYIVSNDGRYIYGVSVAEDCGGSIKNNRIDLYFETNGECIQFGIRNCTVYFLT